VKNLPLESSCVVFALIENYRTSKPSKVCPEKSHSLSCDTVVTNERYLCALEKYEHCLRTNKIFRIASKDI